MDLVTRPFSFPPVTRPVLLSSPSVKFPHHSCCHHPCPGLDDGNSELVSLYQSFFFQSISFSMSRFLTLQSSPCLLDVSRSLIFRRRKAEFFILAFHNLFPHYSFPLRSPIPALQLVYWSKLLCPLLPTHSLSTLWVSMYAISPNFPHFLVKILDPFIQGPIHIPSPSCYLPYLPQCQWSFLFMNCFNNHRSSCWIILIIKIF